MKDPISGQDYEPTPDGMKRWAANELPHGVPLLYAIVGFATISTLATIILATVQFAFSWSAPTWMPVAVALLGVFWAFGGWQHGVEAEADLDTNSDARVSDSGI